MNLLQMFTDLQGETECFKAFLSKVIRDLHFPMLEAKCFECYLVGYLHFKWSEYFAQLYLDWQMGLNCAQIVTFVLSFI
jgi:hypothetical protein